MKAVVYKGNRKVVVQKVPDAGIKKATDVLVKITTTNICGSDLHMYEGRTNMEPGRILGHENLGTVIEIGSAVDRIKLGDRVCMPFNISCGFCENCERGLPGFCLTTNPGSAGAAYGYAGMGPYSGGQAELLRVPYADFNCLVLPPDADEKENDYVMLSDIFPTGLPRYRTCGRTGGRVRSYLRRRAGRHYGCVLRGYQRGRHGYGGGQAQGPAGIGEKNRRYRGR